MPGSVAVDGSIGVVGVIVPEVDGVDIVEPCVDVPRLPRFDFIRLDDLGIVEFIEPLDMDPLDIESSDIVLPGVIVPDVVLPGVVVCGIDEPGVEPGDEPGVPVVVWAYPAAGIIMATAAAIGSIFMFSLRF